MAKRKVSKALATRKGRSPGSSARSTGRKKAAKRAAAEPDDLEGLHRIKKELWCKVAAELAEVDVQGRLQESNEVGRIILESLFNGNFEQFEQFGVHYQTLQALALGSGFSVGYLRYAILIHGQLKELRETLGKTDDVGPCLNITIHRKLLILKDPAVKARVALQIYNKGLESDAASQVINQACREIAGYKNGRGRPKRSVVAKAMPSLIRVMRRVLYEESVGPDGLAPRSAAEFAMPTLGTLRGCSNEKVADLKDEVEALGQMLGDLERLQAGLADVIAEWEDVRERANGLS